MRVLLLGDSLTAGMPGVGYMRFLPRLAPGHEFINEGVCGDTVTGLHARVRRMWHGRADLALVWIGTNDACFIDSDDHRLAVFGDNYRALLADVSRHASRVVTVPPLCIGLEPAESWEALLASMSEVIRQATAGQKDAEFLDLRSEFGRRTGRGPADWLQFTEDGAHLNHAGAKVVAEVFADYLRGSAGRL